jgi:replicative DNA helicase
MNPDKLPPQNLDAERAVLGSMLRDNTVIDDVRLLVGRESFYTDAHQRIFSAIVALHDAGLRVDLVTLAEELHRRKDTENIGGPAYLAELWDAAPTSANAEHYARIVREKGMARALIHVSNEILRDAYDQVQPAEELVAAAEQKIFAIAESAVVSDVADAAQAVGEFLDHVDACQEKRGQAGGIATGFIDLDKKIGGLQPSALVLIAARTSVGKTTLGAALALRFLQSGLAVFFASLEQSRMELVQRMVCALAKVDSHHLREGLLGDEELQRLGKAAGEIRLGTLEIADSSRQTVLHIAAKARRMKRRKGLDAVFVDYVQMVESTDRRAQRYEQVGHISRGLKGMAKDLGVPVVCMAQLNRGPEDRTDKRPRLSDLRESGNLEMDADVVMLMHRPAVEPNVIELHVAKNRNGPTGIIRLTYLPQWTRLENYCGGLPPL